MADELAGLPTPSLATERSLPRSLNQSSQTPSLVIQRFVASEDVASEDHSIHGMDEARTTESIAEFSPEVLPTLSSPLNLASSALQRSAYYGNAATRNQFSAVPNRRIAEPILTSTGWLNIPPDDYPVNFAAESTSQSSISDPAVQLTQSVERRFEALSRFGAISSLTGIVNNYAFNQSGDWQFNRSFQILNNASTRSSPVERFDTDAQTQGSDRPIQRLIQLDTETSSAKLLNVDVSNQSVDHHTQILKKFQEGNGFVGTGLTGQVLGSKDIPTKPTPPEKALLNPSVIAPPVPPILGRVRTQSPPALRDSGGNAEARSTAFIPRFSNATEERLLTWRPLIQPDAISPAPLSNVHVSEPNDCPFQPSDQGLNNFPAISLEALEALSTADAQSEFRVRRAQPLLQRSSQAQSNLSTALSNSVPRDYPDRSSQVLPSDHINSAHIDSAVVLNPSMIRPLSPATRGQTSTQSPSGLRDLKPFSHTRKGDNAEARLAASIPQSSNITMAASRSFVTSAPTVSLAVAELQMRKPAEPDSGGPLPEQTAIRPYQQRINPRSHSILNFDTLIPALAIEQASFANSVSTKLEPLDVARLTTPQSLLELEEVSAASAALSTLQPGTSFLGLPPSPLLPLPASKSSNSAPPPLPSQPDRSPIESNQPPNFPEPMPVIAPPRPTLSLNNYLNRRRRGQR